MHLVRLALRRPYTFVALALFIVILGVTAIVSMPVDIFPNIDIPVVSVVWTFNGISPDEMEKRIVTVFERAMTTTVNDIEHIESQSYAGVSVTRVYFQPNVKIDLAVAQISSIAQTVLRILPPGIFPPNVLKYDAATVPILQLALSSDTLSEQEIYDYGLNFIRTQLATVQGASVPLPYGGRYRQVMVDLDPEKLYAKQLTPLDVSNALNLQNLILPSGLLRLDNREYVVRLNSSPLRLQELNNLPVRTVNGATVLIKDIGQVRDGYSVQTNLVRMNGVRGTLMVVLKNGQASTIDIVNKVKATLPKILAGLPPSLRVKQLFDQSIFVRAAIEGVLKEAIIAAILTGLMILLFLGSWRSSVIICVSIPLSILASIAVLKLLNQTINVMTLGGLALAIGILVDDATVTIENIHRNLAMKKPLTRAVLDGAMQIAVPTFVSSLSICIVFVPVFLLQGASKFLFTPLAAAVVFAMLASYFLSRTLVPTMVHFFLEQEAHLYQAGHHENNAAQNSFLWRLHHAFNRQFERLRAIYAGWLDWALDHHKLVISLFVLFCVGSLALAPMVGEDFFPEVDAGQMRFHARAAAGSRLEETERIFARIESVVRKVIPSENLEMIMDNIGLPVGSTNLAYGDSPTIGVSDGEILISLKGENRRPVKEYELLLRKLLRQEFPDVVFYFEPANMTTQILNFGLPAPIDVQVVGRNQQAAYRVAQQLAADIEKVPGAVDVHIHQVVNAPEIRVDVDRTKASQLGLTQRDVASSLLISLSSSSQVAPNQWLNPETGVNYQVAVQTPIYLFRSMSDLLHTPIGSNSGVVSTRTPDALTGIAGASVSSIGTVGSKTSPAYGNPGALPNSTQLLSNFATVFRGETMQIINHYNVQPVFDVYANVAGTDLGTVTSQVEKIMKRHEAKLPRGLSLAVRGQAATMKESFLRLGMGVLGAIILVYLLLVINFQSWLDPFIILMALPGALAGIVWALFLTQTTFNVPSLMGAIMSIGVATANSILVVVFANDEQLSGVPPRQAALAAGFTRIRPVVMTAAAMIIGMLPMAFGIGEGAEQNAPLGRVVIGGLLIATVSTLLVVPVIYSRLRKRPPVDRDKQIFLEEHEGELPATNL